MRWAPATLPPRPRLSWRREAVTLRLPIPEEIIAGMEDGLARAIPSNAPLWRDLERRMECHVLSQLPRGTSRWRVALDSDRLEVLLRCWGAHSR